MNKIFKYGFIVFVLIWGFSSIEIKAQTVTINSGWQFVLGEKTSENHKIVNIPHTWNKDDAFDDEKGYHRGIGWYKKQLFFSKKQKDLIHYLHFKGANQETDVYVNGHHVGNHKGGYTAFNFNISEWVNYGSYNLIEVKVDNSPNKNIPPLDADFTFYGGIYRDVQLISKPKQHISLSDFASDGFYVDYYHVSEEKAGVEIKILVNNFEDKPINTRIKVTILDAENKPVFDKKLNLKNSAKASEAINIKFSELYNPKLWSPASPYLYKLHLQLLDEKETVLDERHQNIAFRWVSVDADKGFFLNDKPIKLIGVNRHQDYENYGNAVPIELQKKDIHLIKKMRANVLRNAHYPQSRELYDLCDKLGILVWTEIPIVNKVTDTKDFFEVCHTMQKEHIKQYYNHPSVVMFGYMNEIYLRLAFDNKSSEIEKENQKKSAYKLATQLEELTRKLAPNHITVMAGHLNELYNETGIADLPMLFGWNLYFGWYDKDIPDLGIFLDEQHKKHPKRSLLLSEYGPGADIRIFTKTPKKFDFSVEYQAKLHQSYYQQITDRAYMTGMTAWNFTDFGSEFRGDAIPHVNQKGLLLYNREPKEIYHWYKAVLNNEKPFAHIAISYLDKLTLFGNNTYPIQLYANQNTAEIYLNNEKLTAVSFKNGVANLQIPFKNGLNTIKLISDMVSDEKTINVLKINSLDFESFSRFGINIGSHFYFKDKTHQITFVPDQPYKKGLFGYVNGESYQLNKDKHQGIPYNIRNTNSDPLFQTMLEGCTNYKLDIPKGHYKVTLFFVEPKIKPSENIYNLKNDNQISNNDKPQRIFDVFLNKTCIQSHFNLAEQFPEKYGIQKETLVKVKDNEGLTITLKPIEGKPVISGILIEKMN
ncbi:glycoside hydrolase family 2 TIM barrel-domain containing protein [Flavivirga aquimarina]|uniref:Glycoside hydrolase family 2 TIM barrel-domain containing protein n=1 Tax=Flavivirga aquimarina TaxID=2027862 RepID=A0ABT8W8M3_9FLAO|nr:glycoside hydrolase family 2 TIM barrel-domain containing protein [Flavivirga aquimarina]MDO5969436.1 glycoside hydrolase family 2 TIM barrel-domain containing protein [Flavivirga aquimarina]